MDETKERVPGELGMFLLVQDDDKVTWLKARLLIPFPIHYYLLPVSHSCQLNDIFVKHIGNVWEVNKMTEKTPHTYKHTHTQSNIDYLFVHNVIIILFVIRFFMCSYFSLICVQHFGSAVF